MARTRMTYGQAVAVDIAVGLVAGIVAAAAMHAFQSAATSQLPNLEPAERATTKAADTVSESLIGEPVPEAYKNKAALAVHYATGAVIGAAYGLIAGLVPLATAGRGLLFGAAVWGLGDELLSPALGFARRATDTAPEKHAYRIAAHAVFALALDAVRRKLNERISSV